MSTPANYNITNNYGTINNTTFNNTVTINFHATGNTQDQINKEVQVVSSVNPTFQSKLNTNREDLTLTPTYVRGWTSEQLESLKKSVSIYGDDWKEVSNHVNKTANQCATVYQKYFANNEQPIKKNPIQREPITKLDFIDVRPADILTKKVVNQQWKQKEKTLYGEAMEKYGKNWKKVSEHIGSKTPEQCVSYYFRTRPIEDKKASNYRELWKPEEDERLLAEKEKWGDYWDKISEGVGSRGKRQCIAHYYYLKKNGAIPVKKQTPNDSLPISTIIETSMEKKTPKDSLPTSTISKTSIAYLCHQELDLNAPTPDKQLLFKEWFQNSEQ